MNEPRSRATRFCLALGLALGLAHGPVGCGSKNCPLIFNGSSLTVTHEFDRVMPVEAIGRIRACFNGKCADIRTPGTRTRSAADGSYSIGEGARGTTVSVVFAFANGSNEADVHITLWSSPVPDAGFAGAAEPILYEGRATFKDFELRAIPSTEECPSNAVTGTATF